MAKKKAVKKAAKKAAKKVVVKKKSSITKKVIQKASSKAQTKKIVVKTDDPKWKAPATTEPQQLTFDDLEDADFGLHDDSDDELTQDELNDLNF